jgi:hypothetical protein
VVAPQNRAKEGEEKPSCCFISESEREEKTTTTTLDASRFFTPVPPATAPTRQRQRERILFLNSQTTWLDLQNVLANNNRKNEKYTSLRRKNKPSRAVGRGDAETMESPRTYRLVSRSTD